MPHGRKMHFDPSSDEPRSHGCPVCAFMREYLSRYLKILDSKGIQALCGYHVWQVANVVSAVTAAEIFLRLLDPSILTASANRKCDLCARIKKEEYLRVRDFCNTLDKHDIQAALCKCRSLCLPHATVVSSHFPPELRGNLHSVLQNHLAHLKNGLSSLLTDSNGNQASHPGILGRVAEFMVAQRGLKSY